MKIWNCSRHAYSISKYLQSFLLQSVSIHPPLFVKFRVNHSGGCFFFSAAAALLRSLAQLKVQPKSLKLHLCFLLSSHSRCIERRIKTKQGERKRGNLSLETQDFPLKCHVKQRLFLMTAAADHSWISYQSASSAEETVDEVCFYTHTHYVNTNKQKCFVSAACS